MKKEVPPFEELQQCPGNLFLHRFEVGGRCNTVVPAAVPISLWAAGRLLLRWLGLRWFQAEGPGRVALGPIRAGEFPLPCQLCRALFLVTRAR
jgi:hypothetical protein